MFAKLKFLSVGLVAILAFGQRSADASLVGEVLDPPTDLLSQAVELKVGPAYNPGIVSFTLGSQADGDSLAVEAVVSGAMSAGDKAAVVAAAVASADPTGAWTASVSGGELTFKHLVGEVSMDVDVITGFNDTTGSGTKVETEETVVSFTLSLDPGTVAYGYDGMGEPSFMTVSVTDTLTWTRALQGGETPQVLLDALQAFLAAEAGEGVQATRVSESSLAIVLRYEQSAVNWQVTDLGLESGAKGEALRIDQGATLIRKDR